MLKLDAQASVYHLETISHNANWKNSTGGTFLSVIYGPGSPFLMLNMDPHCGGSIFAKRNNESIFIKGVHFYQAKFH